MKSTNVNQWRKRERWETVLLRQLKNHVKHSTWHDVISEALPPNKTRGLHLAIFLPPFLDYIISGQKTIESRFSVTRIPPYMSVAPKDLILLKHSSGAIEAICEVGEAWTYELHKDSLKELREQYAARLCATDSTFWSARKHSRFVTLMLINGVARIEPLTISKRDPRGWVVLNRQERENLSLF